MNARRKSLLLLAVTLVLGLLLGASGVSVLQNRRAAQLREAREAGGMMRMIEEIIQTNSEMQHSQISAVVEDSEKRFREARKTCGEMLQAHRDSLVANLRPVLTEGQQTQLDEWINRERNHQRRSRSDSKRNQ